ncbi:MAG: nucleotidyltransferase, partial [Bacteroidaceae bacterium]|nr:nucleotidyltransferase [Bacteroidaceae bacterium]
YDARRVGFDKVVFIFKEEIKSQFKQAVGDHIAKFIDVAYVNQKLDNLPAGFSVPEGRTKPWGTAHAVMSCLGTVNEPFVVINADDFYGKEAFMQLSSWLDHADLSKQPAEYCMSGYILKNTLTENGYVSRGVCSIDDNGKLIDVTERTKIMRREDSISYTEDDKHWISLDENSIVSMNCWAFPSSFLPEIEQRFADFLTSHASNILKAEFFLPFVVQDMIREGSCTVKVLPTHDQWFGVTYKEDKDFVIKAIAQKVANGEYPSALWREEK